jgi:hypothetical protein
MHHRKHMSCGRYPAILLVYWLDLQNTHHVTTKHCCGVTSLRMRKLHGHKENTAAVLLCDVTAYVLVCLSSRCLETGCITPLFYFCMRVLLSNSCCCGSTVLAWSKYATVHRVSDVRQTQIHTAEPLVPKRSHSELEIAIAK